MSDEEDDSKDGVMHMMPPRLAMKSLKRPPVQVAPVKNDESEEEGSEDDGSGEPRANVGDGEGEDDDDEEEEEDEDDEDESDEDGNGQENGRRRRPSKKKRRRNQFLDVEAEVDDEDEDEDEDDDLAGGADGFIEEGDVEPGIDHEAVNREDAARHQDLDRQRQAIEDENYQQIAEQMRERYGRQTIRHRTETARIPSRLLLPSVNDPSIWGVACRPGREQDLIFSIIRKCFDYEARGTPLEIMSAFCRDSIHGRIYVECRKQVHLNKALEGLLGIYMGKMQLVPIDEMADLLKLRKVVVEVQPGSWARVKRGKYQNDLCQVLEVAENGDTARVKLVPRIELDLKASEERKKMIDASMAGKRKKGIAGAYRPPLRLFNLEEVSKVYRGITRRGQYYMLGNDSFIDGFLEKEMKTSALLTDITPTLEEITRFNPNDSENASMDLAPLAAQARKAAPEFQPGDQVEVYEGEQVGIYGLIESVQGENVLIEARHKDVLGQRIEVPSRLVRKRFHPGDHVKVTGGKYMDETGLIVRIVDNVVTFISDLSIREVSVFSKDLREAAEVGGGAVAIGQYQLHDLVMIDNETAGVIFRVERDMFRILDQFGSIRTLQPQQISIKKDSKRAVATDAEGTEIKISDRVKEREGQGRQGIVLHVHQSTYVFLHNNETHETGGVFVARSRGLVSMAPTGTRTRTSAGPLHDLTKMNPAVASMRPPDTVQRGVKDPLIGQAVAVTQGPHKGQWGIVKDASGGLARLELHSKSGIISIDKTKLQLRDARGNLRSLDSLQPRPGMMMSNGGAGYVNGGATPALNPYSADAYSGQTPAYGGRTPAYGMGGRTPAYGTMDGRTPAYGSGGRTPAWSASSKTPNPYSNDGGKTPAWQVGSKTPNPYAFDPGSKTPGYAWDAGGKTPAYSTATVFDSSGRTPAYGQSAATPYGGAPTPAAGMYGAPTPAASSLTPGANPYYAATPGAAVTAPTPYVGGPYDSGVTPGYGITPGVHSAPTPAMAGPSSYNGSAATPLGAQWLYEGLHVKIKSSGGSSVQGGLYNGQEARITSTNGARTVAQLLTVSGGTLIHDVSSDLLDPVRPSDRRQSIRVVGGMYAGQLGTVVSWDGTEGMVSLEGVGGSPVIEAVHLVKCS